MLNKPKTPAAVSEPHLGRIGDAPCGKMYKTNVNQCHHHTNQGSQKMNAAIFGMILNWMASKPCAMMAAPAKPPISVCEKKRKGFPSTKVNRFRQ